MKERRSRPEGWRALRVGELELWWTASAPRVTAQLATLAQAIAITLSVERADGSGKKLVATLRARTGLRGAQTIAVEPAAVRRLVETAAPRGAWPTGIGTWKTEVELADVALRPEHLDDLVWTK